MYSGARSLQRSSCCSSARVKAEEGKENHGCFNDVPLTGGRIWDWEMMLLGRLFCRLSVVISAQVTWKPVIRWWGATLETRHRKLPVMFDSLVEKEAVRFSGFARTFGSP